MTNAVEQKSEGQMNGQLTREEALEVVKWTKTEDAKMWHEALEQEALYTGGPYEWYCALDRLMYV